MKGVRTWGAASVWASLWLLATALAYLIPNDALAAFTIFPAWTWLVLATVPIFARFRRYQRRVVGGFLGATVLIGLVTTEEWRSLLRLWTPGKPAVRIVVLNCASLSEAGREVISQKPDIVIFTENPGRSACEKIARDLFGKEGRSVVGPDGAILARGPLERIETPLGTHDFTAATAMIGGQEVGLMALRLNPPAFNIALYDPAAWREVADNRQARREEIARIAAWVKAHPEIRLMAGDYNAQPWDPSLSEMPPDFIDAFKAAGTGWGHTAVNDYPLARIDQIWTRDWQPVKMWVRKTDYSDHRMVVADFETLKPAFP